MSLAGDVDYEKHGQGYASQRRSDPRIEALVHAALGTSRTVINVGAGAGSYEPTDRYVVAVEPSETMRAQRPAGRVPALRGAAESLPFDDGAFDAAMATVTVHQWRDHEAGLRELARVSRGPVVLLAFDPDLLDRFWLADYCPELVAAESGRYQSMAQIAAALGGPVDVQRVPIPADCADGFTEAFYARPERMLDPAVRASQSAWTFVDDAVETASMSRLAADLESGEWDRRYGSLRSEPTFLGSLCLVVFRGSARP